MNKISFSILGIFMLFLVIGCGSSSGSNSGGNDNGTPLKGVFVDEPVAGIAYSASPSGKKGFTDDNGTFDYSEGDNITFSIGNLILGSGVASSYMTPFDIALSGSGALIAALIQSHSTLSNGVLTMNDNATANINAVISQAGTSINAAAGSLLPLLSITPADAVKNMQAKSLYGGFRTGGFSCSDNSSLYGLEFFVANGEITGYVDSYLGNQDLASSNNNYLSLLSGKMTSANTAATTIYSDNGSKSAIMELNRVDDVVSSINVALSFDGKTCTGVAVPYVVVNEEDPSCKSIDVSGTYSVPALSYLSTDDNVDFAITLTQDNCNVSATVQKVGSADVKSFKGVITPDGVANPMLLISIPEDKDDLNRDMLFLFKNDTFLTVFPYFEFEVDTNPYRYKVNVYSGLPG